eukprot:gene9237-biopygen15233
MLPRSVSASWRTRFPLRNGVSEFSELSGQISQELGFLVVPGQGPGVSRGPRQSQGSARAEAGQSVGQSPGQGAGGAWPGPRRQPRCLKGGCIPGSWRPKIKKK